MMKVTKTLNLIDRREWGAWLEKNHFIEDEVWLVYPKKRTGNSRIPYNDTVEEALCYGWIDSTVKSINENSYAQRFTPRKKRS